MSQQLFKVEATAMISAQITRFEVQGNQMLDRNLIAGFEIGSATNIGINEAQKVLQLQLALTLQAIDNQQKKLNYQASIESLFSFYVDNLEDFVIEQDNEKLYQGELAATLVGISYSTLRGMLPFVAKGTPIEQFLLPIVNPSLLIPINNE